MSDKGAKSRDKIQRVNMDDIEEDAKSRLKKFLGDISKTSATKQMFLGTSTGWLTGYMSMRVGKLAALALGGGIIILEIGYQQGYFQVNWDKMHQKIDKVADIVEEEVTGKAPTWSDKAGRFLDRKIEQTEKVLRKKGKKTRNWLSKIHGEDGFQLKEIHIFVVSFVAGFSIGIATA